MLTDPRTTPDSRWLQAGFGLVVAVAATLMDRWLGYRILHLFAVLFALSPWVVSICTSGSMRLKAFGYSSIAFLLAVGAIIYLENRPPIHFEMVG